MKRITKAVIVIALITLGIGVLFQSGCTWLHKTSPVQKEQENTYQRVIRTGKIRASYISYPPYCFKDPNTGKLSGIFVDVLEEIGKKLGVKVEWVEEVGWGTIFEGLESGRYDVFGAGLWMNSTRAKTGYFSKPLFYNGVRLWVRADETRIKTLNDVNNSNVRIAVQDGGIDDIVTKTDFPNAKKISIPQMSPWSDCLLNLKTGKADVAFGELAQINKFLEKNPGTLKELYIGRPIRVFGNSYAFKFGEDEFKSVIDATIDELSFDGTIERIMEAYEESPGELLRVAPPYLMPESKK